MGAFLCVYALIEMAAETVVASAYIRHRPYRPFDDYDHHRTLAWGDLEFPHLGDLAWYRTLRP